MPIYEYRCNLCKKKMSFLLMRADSQQMLSCTFCKSPDLTRLFSRFATVRSEESRLESLADPGSLAGLDENDPQSMARWMKKMGKELGEDVGDNFEAEMDKTLSGEASDVSDASPDA
jgi:putative FmdB family regulatory protein